MKISFSASLENSEPFGHSGLGFPHGDSQQKLKSSHCPSCSSAVPWQAHLLVHVGMWVGRAWDRPPEQLIGKLEKPRWQRIWPLVWKEMGPTTPQAWGRQVRGSNNCSKLPRSWPGPWGLEVGRLQKGLAIQAPLEGEADGVSLIFPTVPLEFEPRFWSAW